MCIYLIIVIWKIICICYIVYISIYLNNIILSSTYVKNNHGNICDALEKCFSIKKVNSNF